jgi:hypothetical protein
MAIKKTGGHAVTGVLPNSSDAVQATPAHPNFMPTQGPAANGGIAPKKKGGFPPKKAK